MAEPILRELSGADGPALTALWARVFGDSEELIGAFFRLLPEMGLGVAALLDGQSVGMAYALTGLELARPGQRPRPCGYLYAVAVEESARHLGLGRALSRSALALAEKRGAEILCTLPAEPSLYGWYREILGLDCALRRRETPLKSAGALPWTPLNAAEYARRREELLRERPHLRLSLPALEFERQLCLAYGGGLYAWGNSLAAAYREGEQALIRELLCPAGQEAKLAAALGAALGTEEVLLCTPCGPDEGEPYLAALPGQLPPDCVWNLSFD